ncbi:MAG TPA: S9 family peptidase [Anaerolineales bacterium]|nr:S9 family peptidase [Anaerolineales bacterium]
MTKLTVAPYGSWKSPITTELMTAKSIGLGQAAVDGQDIYWLEGRPLEGGRNVLVRLVPGGRPLEVLPAEINVRTRVHEYGGAAYLVHAGTVYFVDFKDQHLYRQKPGGMLEVLTPTDGMRYADFILDERRERLISVREDHTGAGEAVNTLVAVPLSGGDGQVLAAGYDFYSNPRLSPDGSRLAWLCWNHPNMPWDCCELWTAAIRADGSLADQSKVAGGVDESLFQPEWSPAGVLHFVSDRTGWWNLYRLGEAAEALCPLEAEFGEPQWVFGLRTYDFIGADEILCTYSQGGAWHLARLDAKTGKLAPLDLPFTDYGSPHIGEGFAVLSAGSPADPPVLLKLDLATGRTEVLRRAFEPTIDRAYFSLPQPLEFPTENGLAARGYFYPPANRDFTAPQGELPPLLVFSHGGPTDAASTALRYGIQFWTSRGFAILDVDYGGSSGYGRAYRMRLNGNWGIVDVEDCCNGALWLAEQGRVDPKRLAIRGGSAGGFTTLAALVFKNVFSAGASLYGVSDLEALATDTHKFESRYLDNLVGPYRARKDLYVARSPIHHTDRLATPLILLQGDEDRVVPPSQSQKMYEAVKAKGLPVAYLLFAGEQHGFRQAKNIQRAYEAELYFYSKIFRFDLADPVEPVRIENL